MQRFLHVESDTLAYTRIQVKQGPRGDEDKKSRLAESESA